MFGFSTNILYHGAFSWIAFHSNVTVHKEVTLTYAVTNISEYA